MSDNRDMNHAEEPLSAYGQPLNFDKVWLMFQETNKQFRETDLKFKETDLKFKETDQKFQEILEQMKETDRKIDKLAKLYGNVSENSKDVAEEFFYRGLMNRTSVCGIEYEQVGRMARARKKLQGEYDIVLYNGKTIVVIEVKYKLHPNDVMDFRDRKLPLFRQLFTEYADRGLVGGVAGLSVPEESRILAEQSGFIVLTQSGDNIAQINSEGFVPKRF